MVKLISEYHTLKGKADESCLRLAWATYRDLVFPSFLNLKVSILIMARPCWVLLQSALAVLTITKIIATTTSSVDSTNESCLPLLPRKCLFCEQLNFSIAGYTLRVEGWLGNQKQNNRDALVYLASSSRNIDPRTMSVMEGIPQNGNKQWVQAAQVFWIATKLLFHPLLLSPRQMNEVTVAEPKV